MAYTPYNSSQVAIGPGTLYAAPLGTAEPANATATPDAAFKKVGYTVGGSTFTRSVTSSTVTVEEEIYAIKNTVTDVTAELAFNLAELNASNLLLALNAGIGASVQSTSFETLPDNSIKVEPPDPGNETRIMLLWDAKSSGGAPTDAGNRILIRQAFQTGNIQYQRQKGNTLGTFGCTFSAEKPPTAKPFAFYFDADHAGYVGS